MRGRLRGSVIALAVALILLQLAVPSQALAMSAGHVKVDVFTQKHPYSGRGQNAPSDAFGPQEVVILYAEVQADDLLVENIVVAFNVIMPNGANFSVSARTNISGTASVNFTIATPPINITEGDVFGYWEVIGSVLYAGQTFSDTLTFRVDWIVKLLTVRTIDENLTYRSSFGNGGDVGFEITLRSIALTLRNATISVVVKDELDFSVNFSLVEDFMVQPNEKLLFIYLKATLPKGAHIGAARAAVSAFTAPVSEGGVAFCPAVYADFQITPENPLIIDLHDVAVVAVLPSANPLEPNQNLELTTLVRNEGTAAETFVVSTYFDGILLGTASVASLEPYSMMEFSYVINPSVVTLGNHTVEAVIPAAPHEADLTDNIFNDTVEVKTSEPVAAHDIAVIAVMTSSTSAFAGDVVGINVVVFNKGNESETFDLSVFKNSSLIETRTITGLLSQTEVSFSFSWNTEFVNPGFYQISASAPLLGDAVPSDNSLIDGVVEIKSGGPPAELHDVAVVSVVPSQSAVNAGQIVDISVTVRNEGMSIESFNVTVYYDHVVIDNKQVVGLAPSAELKLLFNWNTTGVVPLKYVFSAVADRVEGETDVADNTFVDGTVTILPYPPFLPPFEWLVFFVIVLIGGVGGLILLILLLSSGRIRRRRPRPTYTVIAHPHI